jgi:hypothetical protein
MVDGKFQTIGFWSELPNLAQVRIRRQSEEDSVQVLRMVHQQIQTLQASIPDNANTVNRNNTISQLQAIINQLQRIESGTTAYLEAQQLLLFAQSKLNQFQS